MDREKYRKRKEKIGVSMGRRLLRVPATGRRELPPLHERPLRKTQRPPRLRKTTSKRIRSRRLRKSAEEITQSLGNGSTRRPSSTVNRSTLRPCILHPKIAKSHLHSHNQNSIFCSSLIERQLHNLRRDIAISNLNVEHGSHFRNIWRDIPHTYANPEGRRERPACNLSDALILQNDFLTLSRDSLVSDLEAHPDPTRSLLLLNLNRSSSHKITLLVRSNSKIESGFDR